MLVKDDGAITKHQMEVELLIKPNPTGVLLLNGNNHMTGDLEMRGKKILPGKIDMNRKRIENMDTDTKIDL